MADLDADGNSDLVTGCFEGGLYILSGRAGGAFGPPSPVLDRDGDVLRIGQYWSDEDRKWAGMEKSKFADFLGISGFPFDWDGDGDFDLVIGTNEGRVFLWRNEGTAKAPMWASRSEALEAGGEPMQVEHHAMPVVADWSGDGRFDVVTGSDDGTVWWFENVGEERAEFAAAVLLVSAPVEAPDSRGTRPQVAVTDFDADGDLDLLVGDYRSVKTAGAQRREYHGYVWLFRREPTAEPEK